MADSKVNPSNQFCTLCQEEDLQNVAVTWCIDCETFLCSNCNKYHGKIRTTKEHSTMSIENYNALPTFITKTKNHCQEHGKRFDAYCSDHGVACCLDCVIGSHKGCKEIQKITDVVKGYKSSSSVFHVETDLSDLAENFEIIKRFSTKRLSTIDEQKVNAEKEIKTMKENIINHLDRIERKLLDDLESTHSEMKSNIKRLNKETETRKANIDHLQTELKKMKEFASELQMYEGIKEMEKLTTEQRKYIKDCQTKGYLNEHNLEVIFSPYLLSITTELASFGNVSVSVSKSHLELNFGKGQQVKTDKNVKPNIDEIKPKIKKTFSVHDYSSIVGCQILSDSRMLFVDCSRKCLMLFSVEGNYVRDVVTFPKHPYDVVYIKDNTVAVASNGDVLVYFVDIESNKIIKTITLSTPCHGIDKDDSEIRLTTGDAKTIIHLDFDGKVKSNQSIDSCAVFIVTSNDNMYFSDYWDDRISCYSKNGECLWTYQLDKGSDPRGMAIDKHGFLYVACNGKNNIIVISPDGKQSSVIFNQYDGLFYPYGLSIDKKTSTLLVVNHGNRKAFSLQLY